MTGEKRPSKRQTIQLNDWYVGTHFPKLTARSELENLTRVRLRAFLHLCVCLRILSLSRLLLGRVLQDKAQLFLSPLPPLLGRRLRRLGADGNVLECRTLSPWLFAVSDAVQNVEHFCVLGVEFSSEQPGVSTTRDIFGKRGGERDRKVNNNNRCFERGSHIQKKSSIFGIRGHDADTGLEGGVEGDRDEETQ